MTFVHAEHLNIHIYVLRKQSQRVAFKYGNAHFVVVVFFPGTYTKIAAACHFRNGVVCQAWAMERLHPPRLPRHPF